MATCTLAPQRGNTVRSQLFCQMRAPALEAATGRMMPPAFCASVIMPNCATPRGPREPRRVGFHFDEKDAPVPGEADEVELLGHLLVRRDAHEARKGCLVGVLISLAVESNARLGIQRHERGFGVGERAVVPHEAGVNDRLAIDEAPVGLRGCVFGVRPERVGRPSEARRVEIGGKQCGGHRPVERVRVEL